ncbi:hypothetical protein Tco_0945978, partial [Tanacetum coccineum]
MLRAILKDDVDMSENDLRYTGYIVDATDGSDDGSKQTALGTWQNGVAAELGWQTLLLQMNFPQ